MSFVFLVNVGPTCQRAPYTKNIEIVVEIEQYLFSFFMLDTVRT